MRKIVMVCICIALLLALPFTSLATQPRQLVPKNSPSVPTPDNGDPDGPTEGFLDDPTDWQYLFKACFWFLLMAIDEGAVYIGIFNITTQEQLEDLFDNPFWMNELVENLTDAEEFIFLLLAMSMMTELYIYFGCIIEAFDVWDLDGDGC